MIGLEALLANLSRIGAEIVGVSHEGVVEGAEAVRRAWVDNIEAEGLVLTGRYRDSVRVVPDEQGAVVSTDVDYSRVLEFGDSRIAPHAVAERAFDEHHDDVLDVVSRRVEAVTR